MSKYEVDAAEWAYLQQSRAKAEARAANARRSAALRAERVRQGVRRAVGRLPANSHSLGHWNLVSQVLAWIAVKGPDSFGLQRVPDRRTVREVLDQMAEERSQIDGHDAASCVGLGAESRDARRTDTQGA